MLQNIVHYGLHFGAVGIIAYWYNPKKWKKYWLILIATMLVDLDHLWANPIFDPDRCSINFHFLHTYWAWAIYILGSIFVKHKVLRLVFIGLSFHLLTDWIDCLWTNF